MILLCAHHDTVRPGNTPVLLGGEYRGLLDNALGMFACHALLFRNQTLLRLSRENRLGIYHDGHEEFLLPLKDIPLTPDLAIVVDVVSGEKYVGLDASIENLTISKSTFGFELREFLADEGYKVMVEHFTGEEMDQDEAWMWKDLHVPTFSILLPINAKGKGMSWHQTDCTCPVERMNTFLDVLTRVICFCIGDYGTPRQA